MKPKMLLKITTDLAMTVSLLLLMTFEMIGEAAHEWIGTGMFVLFIFHHILNRHWSRKLIKGKYGAMRIAETILVVLILLCMVGSMFSGIILSRHVFTFITVRGWHSFARNLHMISAYWGLVLMSVHLGFHWNIILRLAGKTCKKPSAVRKWILRAAAIFIAGYGIHAFIDREIGRYMLLMNHFVFFDYDEPVMFLLMDYAAVMGLFVFVGYYFLKGIKYTVRTPGN